MTALFDLFRETVGIKTDSEKLAEKAAKKMQGKTIAQSETKERVITAEEEEILNRLVEEELQKEK